MKIIPSLLANKNWLNLKELLGHLEKLPIDALHIDVMDGHFVPNLTFGIELIEAIAKFTKLPLDYHLMISCFESMLRRYIGLRPHSLSIHVEVAKQEYLELIQDNNIKVGLAINPETRFSALKPFFCVINKIIIMTVHPGFSGQKFIQDPIDKIKCIKDFNPSIECFVDGGVDISNIDLIRRAGADGVVVGSSFFNSPNYLNFINRLKI